MSGNDIKMTIIRLALLGDGAVGKTSIINRFMNLEFREEFISTIGWDKMTTKVKLENGEEMKLSIWDTAGQERFHASAFKVVRKSQGIALVFDLTQKKTFDGIANWLEVIKDNFNNVSIVLLGNKCDCKEKREVTEEDTKKMIERFKLPYFETSAKENINITEAIQKLANDVYKKANKSIDGIILKKIRKKMIMVAVEVGKVNKMIKKQKRPKNKIYTILTNIVF